MISQKVIATAQENGYKFFVNGFGHRKLAEITDLNGKHISWTSNTSKAALTAINALVKQRELEAASSEAIAAEAIEVIADLLPPIADIDPTVAEQAYLELLPVVDQWELDRAARIASQGALTADDFRSTYSRADDFGDDAFVFSARNGEMALI
jgi:leucyl-tRNA synthetase